jgi:hypothetical protein
MSRTKPTPGPWHYEVDERSNVVIWATRSGPDDKHILGVAQFGPLEQREANARLICAATNDPALCDWCANPLARPMPHETDEMAEVLKACRRYLTNFGSVDPELLKQQIDDALATHELREANAIIAAKQVPA